ncbi:hypothetical protein E3U55_14610 [Filobacillus milosensis]|uniref:Uncharacterized protein n=1 Tax=Filobacillus milosensis TaxID=94137 RepID=A0A4Y8IDS8_9BACI|nr:hypothetical protein [Filobacillus milosensis]TFB14142.1 hypothetical protein E3U55_14610 [Filobacillus milosensis]
MKMKFILSMVFVFVFSFMGCEQYKDNDKKLTLQEEIREVMTKNDADINQIIEYTIEGNYMFVIYEDINLGLNIVLLEYTKDGFKWIDGMGAQGPSFAYGGQGYPILKYVNPYENDVKQVKIFGKSAKKVTYYYKSIDGISIDKSFWFLTISPESEHYSDALGGVEIIKED